MGFVNVNDLVFADHRTLDTQRKWRRLTAISKIINVICVSRSD